MALHTVKWCFLFLLLVVIFLVAVHLTRLGSPSSLTSDQSDRDHGPAVSSNNDDDHHTQRSGRALPPNPPPLATTSLPSLPPQRRHEGREATAARRDRQMMPDAFKPPRTPTPNTRTKNKPVPLQTVTMAWCPCPRDLKGMTVKDVPKVLQTNMDAVISFFQRNGLRAQKGLGRRREALDPEFEVPLMRYAPPQHAVCLPDHTRSKVRLLTPSDQLSVGSPVQLRVDIYNGCGQPRFTGGDEIRVWLKSKDGNSSVAANVKDLHNGSYVADTVLPWPGVTFVRVSLTYAQEFLRFSVELYHTMNSMRYTTETFRSGGIHETVPCLPSPPIPGYADTCNFTAANGDRPWFCGRPLDSRLDCSHRATFSNLDIMDTLPVPQPLQQYVQQLHSCCRGGNYDLRLIPHNITLWAPDEKAPPGGPLPPCYSRPVKESWVTASPRGWLRHGHWLPSTCTLPPLSQDRIHRCLRNTRLLLSGDSNQRILWKTIADKIGCTTIRVEAWNAPHICQNADLKATLLYVTHALPFSPGTHGGYPVTNMPLPVALDHIQKLGYRDNKNLTVVLHYDLHLSTHPVQVYRSFVKRARKTIQEYLNVYPHTKFVIRGPHVMYQGHDVHAAIGDKFAHWYQRLWMEEFAELSDRVWYLDTWDLTIASENPTNHPVPVLPEIAKMLFGYMCDAA